MPATLAVREPYLVGLVLGDAQDRAALAIVDRIPGAKLEAPARHRLVRVRRWPLGTPYPVVVEAVRVRLAAAPLVGATSGLVVDATGVGRPFVDLLGRSGLVVPVLPVVVTAGGRVMGDELGWRVPLRDLVGAVQMLQQAGRLVMAEELPEAEAMRADQRRFLERGAEGDAAVTVARTDALVLAVALVCWWGEVISPALVEWVPGDFSAFSQEAMDYERQKRRIKGRAAPPDWPMPESIG
jgi:hypothetical protein